MLRKQRRLVILLALLGVLPPAAHAQSSSTLACGASGNSPLANVSTWMYQLAGLDTPEKIAALASQPYDMVVIDPNNTLKGSESFDTTGMVSSLHQRPTGTRKVIAYIDIGQAESYRSYWGSSWQAPTSTSPGSPDFLLTIDPDGWSGNYPVAFWDPRWQSIWLGSNGLVAQIAREGFDGVYLDWIQAYTEPKVVAAAQAAGVDPVQAMVDFMAQIRAAGKAVNPNFVVIQQNAASLMADAGVSQVQGLVDGIAQEDTWFGGQAGADWSSPNGGDIAADPADTQSIVNALNQYCAANEPVFTIDYALIDGNVRSVYAASRTLGFRPLVSRVALSQPTTTPPWNY